MIAKSVLLCWLFRDQRRLPGVATPRIRRSSGRSVRASCWAMSREFTASAVTDVIGRVMSVMANLDVISQYRSRVRAAAPMIVPRNSAGMIVFGAHLNISTQLEFFMYAFHAFSSFIDNCYCSFQGAVYAAISELFHGIFQSKQGRFL
jgi:hypothetical protein